MMGFDKVTTGKTPKTSKIQIIAKKVDRRFVDEGRFFNNNRVVSSTFIIGTLCKTSLLQKETFSTNLKPIMTYKFTETLSFYYWTNDFHRRTQEYFL